MIYFLFYQYFISFFFVCLGLDLGSECHFDLMCQILAVCKLNKCVCDESHYFNNQRCFQSKSEKKKFYLKLCQYFHLIIPIFAITLYVHLVFFTSAFFLTNNFLIAENHYGESCETNSCISKNMICRNKCTCKEGYTYIDPDCKSKYIFLASIPYSCDYLILSSCQLTLLSVFPLTLAHQHNQLYLPTTSLNIWSFGSQERTPTLLN